MKVTIFGQDFYLPNDNIVTDTEVSTSDDFIPISGDNGDNGDRVALITSLKGGEKNRGQWGQGITDKTNLEIKTVFPSHTGGNRNNPIPPIPTVPKPRMFFDNLPCNIKGNQELTSDWLTAQYRKAGFLECNDILRLHLCKNNLN